MAELVWTTDGVRNLANKSDEAAKATKDLIESSIASVKDEYKAIFARNADRLKNANTIYEGQVIVLPVKRSSSRFLPHRNGCRHRRCQEGECQPQKSHYQRPPMCWARTP